MREIRSTEVGKLKNPIIIDVREDDEVRTGKIPGSINIPLSILEFKMYDLDKAKEYIIVCHSGARSILATRFLLNHGYNVINMVGGMLDWKGIVV
ncbi:rhodanese [Anaerobacillus alkalidiazotrophicus]|uniref:Rhodanese n=1 Tax=Anaerobacillus alkalidiazotrophicus TaxID=472963 RepID=A0A1S2M3C9_9BACI|nr:rhodanese-like domain-containing protein [Anaerobacillus alkalidiazotrophicus]OIJ19272.1 rhodanese [Anaerobacillus alkalidiazotrophicus]